MKKKILNFDTIAAIFLVIMTIYLTCCVVEITHKGTKPNPQYSKYNIIVTATNWATEYHENK